MSLSYVWQEVAALFGLLPVTSAVVVPIQNVLARVEPFFHDAPGDILASIERHPTAPYIVGRSSRRALTRMVEVCRLAVLDGSIVGTFFAAPAGASHAVESRPNRVARWPALLGRDQRLSAVIVGDIEAVVFDVVLDETSHFLADPVPPRTLLLVFQRRAAVGTVNELDCWT